MIKDVILPERIGSFYLFPKRIVGLEITKNYVYATVIYLHGNSTTIEQCLEVAIEQDNGEDLVQRTATAIKKVITAIGSYSEVHATISSAQTIFKTMKLPFNDYEKIKHIIEFEVEPLLPFSINDAIIDFIVTKEENTEKSSEVFIAAVQKQYVKQLVDLLHTAGIQPKLISIDMIQLYGFYKMIPQYNNREDGIMLLDIDSNNSKTIFVFNGQLRFIRTINAGVSHLAQTVGASVSKQNTTIDTFINKLKISIQSIVQSYPNEKLSEIIILGSGATITGLDQTIQDALQLPCSIFKPEEIASGSTTVHLKKISMIPVENSISTASAMITPITEQVNFLQKEFAVTDNTVLIKQLILAIILIATLFSSLLIHDIMQLRTLGREVKESKAEAMSLLTEWFPSIEADDIESIITEADEEIKKEERLWFSFGQSAHTSLLSFLLELTELDREALGLIIDKVDINKDKGILLLKAQVKDHNALKILEKELLQSKLFTYVQKQDDIDFVKELRFATGSEGIK